MLVVIENLFSKEQVLYARQLLEQAVWVDGKKTAGMQSGSVKYNQQLSEESCEAKEIGEIILDALSQNAQFISAALPQRIFPPLFNKYEGGEHFGVHVDNAIRAIPNTVHRIRTDLSCTLFFSEPDEYEGGELVIEGHYGAQAIKLPAGSMVLYPSTSLHLVQPVTKGARISSFFWMQSMLRNNEQRSLLYDMDQTIQNLTLERGVKDENVVRLTGIYHNLLRQWVET